MTTLFDFDTVDDGFEMLYREIYTGSKVRVHVMPDKITQFLNALYRLEKDVREENDHHDINYYIRRSKMLFRAKVRDGSVKREDYTYDCYIDINLQLINYHIWDTLLCPDSDSD